MADKKRIIICKKNKSQDLTKYKKNSELNESLKIKSANECYLDVVIRQIERLIRSENYKIAFKKLDEISSQDVKKEYKEFILNAIKRKLNEHIKLGRSYNCESLVETLPAEYGKELFEYVISCMEIQQHKKEIKFSLEKYNFIKAEALYSNYSDVIEYEEYINKKSKFIRKYFLKYHNIQIDTDQALAIAKNKQNILVTARAGSGKTRTIACRAIYAIEKENINPNEIMILAFNRIARAEINHRICKKFNYPKFNSHTAKTFHSLAYSIVHPAEDLLFDDSNVEVEQKLSEFVKNIYENKKITDPSFQTNIYNLYRNDDLKVFDDSYFYQLLNEEFSKQEIRKFLSKKRLITLKRDHVKSRGEKWIADFLFEHDIEYSYEEQLTQINDRIYKPDFIIRLKNNVSIVLEHWGIDENEKNRIVPYDWTKSWDDYQSEMQWKRAYCIQTDNVILIETSIADMKQGRIHFEKILKSKLEDQGIECKKLNEIEILNRIEEKFKDKFAKRLVSFILKAKRYEMNVNEIKSMINRTVFSNRTLSFLNIALEIYADYEKLLKDENKTDFETIMKRAIDKIHSTKGNCEIYLGKDIIKLNDLKFILIDEFQDFSKQFFALINAIKSYNPTLKLFCVGDDWQAINGFAGSDLLYFNKFEDLFSKSDSTSLTFNYRSSCKVVDEGNRIMQGYGTPAKSYNKDIGGRINLVFIDDVKFKSQNGDLDRQFMSKNELYFGEFNRYLKKCCEIIIGNIDKSFIIMHRFNKMCHYKELFELQGRIVTYLRENHFSNKSKEELFNQIQVGTVHQFKGCEADIAIILECNKYNYPCIHTDCEVDLIFGRTPMTILEEERRLFYVAITRAKESVYLISERNNESEFINFNKLSKSSDIFKVYDIDKQSWNMFHE